MSEAGPPPPSRPGGNGAWAGAAGSLSAGKEAIDPGQLTWGDPALTWGDIVRASQAARAAAKPERLPEDGGGAPAASAEADMAAGGGAKACARARASPHCRLILGASSRGLAEQGLRRFFGRGHGRQASYSPLGHHGGRP